MPDDHTITAPNLREDADPCTLSHRDETLRARSLDQAQAHQPDPEERSPANHPPRQQRGVFQSSKIVFLPSLTRLLRSQQLQGQGQHYRAPSGRQLGHTTSPVHFAVFRRKAPRELHAEELHAHQLTPRWVQPPRGPLQGCSPPCSPCGVTYWLLSKVQRKPETPTILGCTWWLRLSSITLTRYSREVFLHPGCTPLCLRLRNLNWDCALMMQNLQRSNRHVARQRPLTTQGGDEIAARALTHSVLMGLKQPELLLLGRGRAASQRASYRAKKSGRQPCPRHPFKRGQQQGKCQWSPAR